MFLLVKKNWKFQGTILKVIEIFAKADVKGLEDRCPTVFLRSPHFYDVQSVSRI